MTPARPEYTIEYATGIFALVEQVNQRIAEGWTPLGGVCDGKAAWYQAMIRLPQPAAPATETP